MSAMKYVWLWSITEFIDLNEGKNSAMLNSGGRYLLTGKYLRQKFCHNDYRLT